MNTWFHGVANLTLAQRLTRRAPWLRLPVVFYASLLPDIPLFILTMWYFVVYEVGFGPAYDTFYYEHPLWVISHNIFHGPLVIATVALAGRMLWQRSAGAASRPARAGAVLMSFAFGTGLHSVLDIFTHNDDGPLLLFPFDWSIRFSSPVSYWDPAHYGLWVLPVETVATIAMTIYLIRRRRRAASTPPRSPRAR